MFCNDTGTTEIYTYDPRFPYTTLCRSARHRTESGAGEDARDGKPAGHPPDPPLGGHEQRLRQPRVIGEIADENEHRQDAQRVSRAFRSEEHTSELQSLMRISYAVF